MFRELMENLGPEVSRGCLDRREMKVPEVSLDPLVPLVCRLVPLFAYTNSHTPTVNRSLHSHATRAVFYIYMLFTLFNKIKKEDGLKESSQACICSYLTCCVVGW